MRIAIFTAILAAGLATAGLATAQLASVGQDQGATAPVVDNDPFNHFSFDDQSPGNVRDRYAAKVMVLKAQMRKLARQDGGQLSEAHRASLQTQLDELNKSFGIKPTHG